MRLTRRFSLRAVGIAAAVTVMAVAPTYGASAHEITDRVSASGAAPDGGETYIETSESDALFGTSPELNDTVDAQRTVQAASASFLGKVTAHNAHESGTQASGHVTWELVEGTNRKVKLTSTLMARTSWVTFRTMAGPTAKSVYAGGGAGKAAVARYNCKNTVERDWYTYGAAYAPGEAKPFGSHSSSINPVKCDGGLD